MKQFHLALCSNGKQFLKMLYSVCDKVKLKRMPLNVGNVKLQNISSNVGKVKLQKYHCVSNVKNTKVPTKCR